MGYCSEGDRTMKHPRLGVKRPRKGWCMLVYLVGRSMELFEHRVSANIDGHSVNHHFPTRDVLYFLRYHCITNFQTCPPWVFFRRAPKAASSGCEWIKAPIWRQGLAADSLTWIIPWRSAEFSPVVWENPHRDWPGWTTAMGFDQQSARFQCVPVLICLKTPMEHHIMLLPDFTTIISLFFLA